MICYWMVRSAGELAGSGSRWKRLRKVRIATGVWRTNSAYAMSKQNGSNECKFAVQHTNYQLVCSYSKIVGGCPTTKSRYRPSAACTTVDTIPRCDMPCILLRMISRRWHSKMICRVMMTDRFVFYGTSTQDRSICAILPGWITGSGEQWWLRMAEINRVNCMSLLGWPWLSFV